MIVDSALLEQYKTTIGVLVTDTSLDDYYTNFLSMAIADLSSDNISETNLASSLGRALIVLFAQNLMNSIDNATNPTIILLRNKLSIMTDGDEVDE